MGDDLGELVTPSCRGRITGKPEVSFSSTPSASQFDKGRHNFGHTSDLPIKSESGSEAASNRLFLGLDGAPGEIRTPDLLIRSLILFGHNRTRNKGLHSDPHKH